MENKVKTNEVYFTLTKFTPINGKKKKSGESTYGYRICDDFGSLTVDHFCDGSKQCDNLLGMTPQQVISHISRNHAEFMDRIYSSGIYINNVLYMIDEKDIIVEGRKAA